MAWYIPAVIHESWDPPPEAGAGVPASRVLFKAGLPIWLAKPPPFGIRKKTHQSADGMQVYGWGLVPLGWPLWKW